MSHEFEHPRVGDWLTVSDDRAPSSGVGQIDDEQIKWDRTRTSGGLPQIRIDRRGVNGTTAAPHAAGAALFEVRSGTRAYGYIVCENIGAYKVAEGSVVNVRVNDVLQTGSGVEIVYDDTTLVPGRSFVVIWFSALPVLKRQVTLGIDDQLTVGDNIAVTSPSLTTIAVASTTNPVINIQHDGQFSGSTTRTYTADVEFPSLDNLVNTLTRIVISGFQPNGTVTIEVDGHRLLSGVREYVFGDTRLRRVRVVVTVTTGLANNVQWSISGTADATDAITINKSGNASRSGTIALTGNSTADVVIGGAYIKRVGEVLDPIVEAAHRAHKVAVGQRDALLKPAQGAKRVLGERMEAYDREVERQRREAELAAQRERERLEAEERERVAAEQRRLQAEADERALAAAVAAEQAGDTQLAERIVAAPPVVPTVAPRPVFTPPVAAPPRAVSQGISFRDNYSAKVTDLMALVRAIAAGTQPITLVTANQTALNQLARALKDKLAVPGVEAVNDRTTATRA